MCSSLSLKRPSPQGKTPAGHGSSRRTSPGGEGESRGQGVSARWKPELFWRPTQQDAVREHFRDGTVRDGHKPVEERKQEENKKGKR